MHVSYTFAEAKLMKATLHYLILTIDRLCTKKAGKLVFLYKLLNMAKC